MKKATRLFKLPALALGLALAPAGLSADWCAQYFNNRTLSGSPDTVRVDTVINNNWGGGAPAGTGLGTNNYSVRWTTTVRWDRQGTFTLRTGSDDGVRVWVDGVLRIDNWDDHGYENDYYSEWRADETYSTIVMEYYENGGDAIAELYWDRPGGGTNYVVIPDNRTTAPACSGNTPTITPTATRTATPLTIHSPTVSPTPSASPTQVPGCDYQAEAGAEPANMAVGVDGGRNYLYATASNTTCCSEYKDFAVTVASGGTYQVWAWVRPASGSADSWFVEMRNAASTAIINDTAGRGNDVWDMAPPQHTAAYGVWGQSPVWGRNGGGGVGGSSAIRNWVLSAGNYTLRFYRREANADIDCFTLAYISPGPTSTPSPGPTFTATPTGVPVWAGLPSSERLYGLEYIPFPDSSTGATNLGDLAVTFTSSAANTIGRNTARWRIELQGLSAGVAQVETRLGPHGVTCTTGYYNPADYESATALSLPSRPSNYSATYAWVNTSVPPTERFDTVGDPRFIPYADVVGQPSAKDHLVLGGYNWFFKNLGDNSWQDYEAEYTAFLPEATRNRYNNQPNADVPKLMMLWREGIMISRSVYNSLSGWSNYYIGLGGEIGGDSSNNLNNGVPMYGGPWNSTNATYNVDEIIGTDGRGSTHVDGATLVRSSSTSWRSLPFLGELWPDELYVSDWSASGGMATWGNLRNSRQGGSSYRDEWQDSDVNDSAAQTFYTYDQVKHRTQDRGARTFMNGNNGSGTFDHWGVDYNAALMADGTAIANTLNFAMPGTFSVNRPWTLNGGGGLPAEWSDQPYAGRRTTLDIYSTGFYNSNTTGTVTQRASATIRARNASVDSGGNTLLGYFIVSGLRPSTESGINFVARFSLLTCLRTFLDAGAPTLSSIQAAHANFSRNLIGSDLAYRIQPPPLVQVTEPYKGQNLAGYQSIQLRWKQRYARWDGDRYTESYPCVDDNFPPCAAAGVGGDPLAEWHDTGAIDFNVKYSTDGGANWFSAMTDDPAKPGEYMAGADSIPFSTTRWYTYNWDVASLPAGLKKVRVEAYRRSLDLHYSFHEINLETAP